MIHLWKETWKISKAVTIVIAVVGLVIVGTPLGFLGFILGQRHLTVQFPDGYPLSKPVPGNDQQQLATLRIRYGTAVQPEIIEADNVLKPMSFQFVSDGDTADGVKPVKWTLLVMTFDKPVSGSNIRVLFDNGAVTYERKTFTPRNASFVFEGSVIDKVIQIDVRP